MKRTAIFSEGYVERAILLFSDERWANIRHSVPELPADKDAELREAITDACANYLTGRNRLAMGQANAAALHRRSARELSEFERFTKALREATSAWASLQGVHDDLLSDKNRFNELAAMASDADRRLASLRALGEATTVPAAEAPWRHLIGAIFRACEKVGLRPGATGRVYDHGARPTWFQEFVLAVNDNLLGKEGYPKHSIEAFHAETLVAVQAVR